MKVDLTFTVNDLENIDIGKKVVVIIDVLRATSTMTHALNNGALSIMSVEEIERAVDLKRDDSSTLLCGERNGQKIDGFDKGNSPSEFNDIKGFNLIFSSTSGSKNIEKAKNSKMMYLSSFLNAKAIANQLIEFHSEDEIIIACSGKQGNSCMEDTLCAGYIIDILRNNFKDNEESKLELDDASKISRGCYRYNEKYIFDQVGNSEHGRYLTELSMKKDIEFCCQKDIYENVPFFHKGKSKFKNFEK